MSAQPPARRKAIRITLAAIGSVFLLVCLGLFILSSNHSMLERFNDRLTAQKVPYGITAVFLDLTEECFQSPAELTDNRPLSSPLLTDEEIVIWIATTIPEIISLDHNNYKAKLLAARKNFSRDGWCNFMQAMRDARILELILDRKLTASLAVTGDIKLTESTVKNGVYHWASEAPATLNFTESDKNFQAPLPIQGKLHLTISRLKSDTRSNGIAIDQFLIDSSNAVP